MNISEVFIKKPIMTVLVMLTVLAFGITSYFKLPISDLPEVQSPVITISASYPGGSPETMASAVASPIENQCMQIPGLQSIISSNTEGNTQITLTFDLNTNVDLAAPDVQAAISRASSNLPTLPSAPAYSKNNPSDAPIIYILVSSDTLTTGQIYEIANKRIAQRINMIQGVSQVQTYGSKEAAVINIDPDKLAAYDLGFTEVADILQQSTVMAPGGSLNGNYKAFSIEPKGQLVDQKEYNNLIIKYKDKAPVRISSIGRAINGTENDVVKVVYHEKGGGEAHQPALILVSRRSGSNTIELSGKVQALLKKLQNEVPGSVKIKTLYDRATTIKESVDDVKLTLLLAFILVVLVIFIFLGRASDTIIPAISLPLSIISTFLVMYIAGFTIDNLSLLALTVAIGFVVDDAIVVLENSVRLVEEGLAPFNAAIQSCKEITGTVISMTLSLVTVFIPLVFMGGIVGRTFREFALTVIIAVVCSGIISLTLTPMMCARMLKPNSAEKRKNLLQRFTDWFVNGLIKQYSHALKFILKKKYMALIIWGICLIGTFVFYTFVPKGFLPVGDSGMIQGGILVPLGTPSKMMQKFQNEINEVLENDKNIDHFVTATGLAPGADQSAGFLIINLINKKFRGPIDSVVGELSMKMMNLNYPLGFVFMMPYPVLKISTGGQSTAAGSKYSYTISGPDKENVYKCAEELKEALRKVPIFVGIQSSVKLDMPQLSIKILRDRASTYGITAADIENTLALAFAQGKLAQYTTDIDQYEVIIKIAEEFQNKPEDLSKLYVRSSRTGKLIPLKSIAEWTQILGPQQVLHTQQLVSATISFSISPNVPIGVATNKLRKLSSRILTPGVSGAFEGEAQEFEDAIAAMGVLVLISVFLMYVILGVLYESYIHPFTVLTTLPVAAFGGIGTLLLFNSELDLYAYVGLFMLLGIIAKNGIMMVDFAKQNREKGEDMFNSIYDSCLVRFRPILMTGVAAIMGALPIAIGVGADGSSRVSLGLVIVGGLIFSQIITLFVTPGIYLYMEIFQEKVLDKFEITRSDAARNKK
ncbi:MAG: efflux RND transporter permease subunit [bacterium]|nr:efflux RND transporter permease subunit [bacterium]